MRLTNLFIYTLLFFGFTQLANAQEDNSFEISFYADIAMNASKAEHRVFANEKLIDLLRTSLEKGEGFQMDLDSNIWVSTIVPPDSSFKIISCQVELDGGEWKYDNFLIKKDGSFVELKEGDKELFIDAEYSMFTAEECLGLLYYKILPNKNKKGKVDSYLLFGYRGFGKYEKVKVVDVLHFIDDQPVFGKELFYNTGLDQREDVKNRLMMRYAADSQAFFKYNPDSQMIIFDHLISRMGQLPGQGPTQVSDGSYEAYFYDKGRWIYKEKLFNEVSEKVPVPEPVFDKRQNNLFGKGK